MRTHIKCDYVHAAYSFSDSNWQHWNVSEEEKALLTAGEQVWRSGKKGAKCKTPEAKLKGKALQ